MNMSSFDSIQTICHVSVYISYKCQICSKLLQEPVQTKHGHRFCKECYLKNRMCNRCILCAEDGIPEEKDCFTLDMKDVHDDKGAWLDILKFPAQCRVCGYEGTYREIKRLHIDVPCMVGWDPIAIIYQIIEMIKAAFQRCA